MTKKTSTLCTWTPQEITAKAVAKVASEPRFFCTGCARVARKKKWLCDPEKLPAIDRSPDE